jgi:hypothetical protein
MRQRSNLALLAVLALLALSIGAAGCGSDSPTEPIQSLSQDDADDIVQQLAVTSASSDWGSFLLAGGTPPSPDAAARPARLRPGRPGSVARWDTTFTQGNLTFTFSLFFSDIALDSMPSYNPLTTWQIEEDSEAGGTIDLTGFQAAVWHLGNLQFRGTRASDDTLEFSGTARDTAYSHFTAALRPVERWFHVDVVRLIDGARTLKTAGSYPHEGTVRWFVTATRLRSASRADVEATLDAEAVLTFDGTRYPRLTITGGWTYTVDLDTGAIVRL